jgi:hypothetical protein
MAEPPDQILLLRAIWWDRDYDQDELVASKVFPSDDLRSPRYISVDRQDMLDETELKERLAGQRMRSEEKGTTVGKNQDLGSFHAGRSATYVTMPIASHTLRYGTPQRGFTLRIVQLRT